MDASTAPTAPTTQRPIEKWTPEEIHEWLSARERTDARREYVAAGFGDGRFTLYLRSPKPERKVVFKDGEPAWEFIESCTGLPEIAELRDRVLRSMVADSAAGIVQVDLCFLAYAAAVIRLNYTMADDDMALLFAGKAWHRTMVDHLLGGEEIVRVMATISPSFLLSLANVQEAPAPVPAPAAKRPWWRFW